jgi:hypothetical protein
MEIEKYFIGISVERCFGRGWLTVTFRLTPFFVSAKDVRRMGEGHGIEVTGLAEI